MDANILLAISKIVAQALNAGSLSGIGERLDSAMPAAWEQAQRASALDEAVVYALVAEQPGYPEDGQPGYLSSDADLKAAVLNEIDEMIKADFDKAEHRQIWQSIQKSVEGTPEADFIPGVAVNCPDDYLLTLDKLSCGDVLRAKNALESFI